MFLKNRIACVKPFGVFFFFFQGMGRSPAWLDIEMRGRELVNKIDKIGKLI